MKVLVEKEQLSPVQYAIIDQAVQHVYDDFMNGPRREEIMQEGAILIGPEVFASDHENEYISFRFMIHTIGGWSLPVVSHIYIYDEALWERENAENIAHSEEHGIPVVNKIAHADGTTEDYDVKEENRVYQEFMNLFNKPDHE